MCVPHSGSCLKVCRHLAGARAPEIRTSSAHFGCSPPTIDEVRARIRKTVDFAESVKEAQYADARERRVSLS